MKSKAPRISVGISSILSSFLALTSFLGFPLASTTVVAPATQQPPRQDTSSTTTYHPDILTDTGADHVIALTQWNLSSTDHTYTNISARGVVPGDVLSILLNSGIINDPYLDRNFLVQRHLWMGIEKEQDDGNFIEKQWNRTWVYSTTFETPKYNNSTDLSWKVILEGIKMGADIMVNGIKIGQAIDQFLRYDMDIHSKVLQLGVDQNNTLLHYLTISFDPSIEVNGRFTACSGGWDWAPYAREKDAQGRQMFTLGVVKPVTIIGIQNFYIAYIVPKIYYLGDNPTSPMYQPAADFQLDVDIHINYAPGRDSSSGLPDLMLKTDFFGRPTRRVQKAHPAGESKVITVSVTVPKDDVELWWPNGMGKQPLYNVSVGLTSLNQTQWIQKRVGFRVSALVTSNDTAGSDETQDEDKEGSGHHGMYFRVNGAVVLARGANYIPGDQLEGRLSGAADRIVVQSAASAKMNMIRIWGGGMVPSHAFYDECDKLGVLVYHDMTFVDEERHRPGRSKTVENEVRHLVRTHAYHPSIAVWSGCNECDVVMNTDTEIYASFVMKTVAEEDDTRSIWPSSPSKHGWKSGVRKVDSRPLESSDSPLATFDPNAFLAPIETHGPYMRAYSYKFPAQNGLDVGFPYTNTPPSLYEVNVGVAFPNEFSSEFGSSVMSSFESMTGTISPPHWSLHGGTDPDTCTHDHGNNNKCNGTNVLAERNYPCDSHIRAYFGLEEDDLSEAGEYAFQKQLYMCLMSQTLWMKGEIETRRAKNMFGMLIWQLNENFPTGGWGVIEYSKKTQDGSQIFGGRWKPLMHLLESSLFRDQIVACGKNSTCYLRNDGMHSVNVTVSFEAWTVGRSRNVAMTQPFVYSSTINAGNIQWFTLPENFILKDNQVALITMESNAGSSANPTVSESVYLNAMPKELKGLKTPVNIKLLSIEKTDKGTALLSLESDGLALFVVLTTRAEGRFADNCFTLRPLQKKIVEFRPFIKGETADIKILKSSLRMEHLGKYTKAGSHRTSLRGNDSAWKTVVLSQ